MNAPEFHNAPIAEHKVATNANGVKVARITAYLATWQPDQGGIMGVPDQFHRGAFEQSLQEYRDEGDLPIPFNYNHPQLGGVLVGVFPIAEAFEDEVGLYVVGEINLETETGREVYALIRQRAINHLSIGFKTRRANIDGGIRHIFEAAVIEGSAVSIPANRGARILEVKFADFGLAPAGAEWNADEAVVRLAGVDDPSGAFAAVDTNGAFALPIADVVDGQVAVVPSALLAAAERLTADGGVELKLSNEARAGAIATVERYCAKANIESPFDREERRFFGAAEVKTMTRPELSAILKDCGRFSKAGVRDLVARLTSAPETGYPDDLTEQKSALAAILEDLRGATAGIRGEGG